MQTNHRQGTPGGGRSIALAVIAMAVFLTAPLAACGDSSTEDKPQGAKDGVETIRVVAYKGTLFSFPLDVAEAEGFLTENGLKVEPVASDGAPAATAALASGSADVIPQGIDNALIARGSGIDMVALTGIMNSNTLSLVVRKDVPRPHESKGYPDSMKDLEGLTLGVAARGAAGENQLKFMLGEAEVDLSDVTFLATGFPATSLPALKQGKIDAYMSFEPMTSQVVLDGIADVMADLPGGEVPSLDWDALQWVTTNDALEKRASVLRKFKAAMEQTAKFMQDPANRPRVVALLTEIVAAGDRELARRIADENLEYFDTTIRPESVKKTSDFLLKYKTIKEPAAAEDYLPNLE